MKVYRELGSFPADEVVLTIGNFDGVHKGHRTLIQRLHRRAAGKRAVPTVVTFDPHPQKVLRGEAPKALVTLDKKIELLAECGVERLLMLPFTKQLASLEPEDFVQSVLMKMKVAAIVVGSNFRFGRMARGDVTMLKDFGKREGFEVDGVRLATRLKRTVSSTEIRHALLAGDVGWARGALGRWHSVPGVVVKGEGRGRQLGYPTANVRPADVVVPGEGVYAGTCLVEGKPIAAAISVGTNPTFGDNPVSLEAHLLDWQGDIYGAEIEVEFISKLRDQRKFVSEDALTEAIGDDVKAVAAAKRKVVKRKR